MLARENIGCVECQPPCIYCKVAAVLPAGRHGVLNLGCKFFTVLIPFSGYDILYRGAVNHLSLGALGGVRNDRISALM